MRRAGGVLGAMEQDGGEVSGDGPGRAGGSSGAGGAEPSAPTAAELPAGCRGKPWGSGLGRPVP